MINPFKEINWHPKSLDLKSFGKSMIIGLSAISAIFFLVSFYRTGDAKASLFLPFCVFSCGVLIFVVSRICASALLPVYLVWFFFSAVIGIVVSNLALMLFFYLFFTPFAIALRLVSGRDPLSLKERTRSSYWKDYSQNGDLKRYFRQY